MPARSSQVSNQLNARAFPWGEVALGIILLFAAGLRVAGIDAGLPLIFNGDEVYVVEHALAITPTDLNPHAFFYGSLPFYLLKLVMVVASVFNGSAPGLSDYYLLSRLTSAAFGTATVFLVFVFGKRIANTGIGLLSAAIFAFSPLAVQLSHYATVDSMMGFWSALSLVGMLVWLKGDPRGLYFASLSAGLAIATKYNAAVLLVPLFLIAVEREWVNPARQVSRRKKFVFLGAVAIGSLVLLGALMGRSLILSLVAHWTTRGELQPIYIQIFDRMLAVSSVIASMGVGLACGLLLKWKWVQASVRFLTSSNFLLPIALVSAVFVVVSPFVILDLPSFTRDFFFQLNHIISGGIVGYSPGTRSYLALADGSTTANPLQYLQAVGDEWGILISISILAGLWALWRKDSRIFIPFGSLVLVLLVVTATWRYEATRYLFPLWTLFAIFGALGINYIGGWLSSWMRGSWLSRVAVAGIVVVALQAPLRSSIEQVRAEFLTPDTRTAALDWVETHVPPKAYILREWGTPEIERANANYRVDFTGFPFEEATLADWKNRGVSIIMISTERYDFYQSHAAAFRDVLAEYDKLKSEGRLLESFEPGRAIKGPPIYIYAVQ